MDAQEQGVLLWGALSVQYSPDMKNMILPGMPNSLAILNYARMMTEDIGPNEVLFTDQGGVDDWINPQSGTPDEAITIFSYGGKKFIWEGHHRVARARLDGGSVRADVYYLKDGYW